MSAAAVSGTPSPFSSVTRHAPLFLGIFLVVLVAANRIAWAGCEARGWGDVCDERVEPCLIKCCEIERSERVLHGWGRGGVLADRGSRDYGSAGSLLRCTVCKMALYYGGENDDEFVSYRPSSRDPSPTSRESNSEAVLMGYPNVCPLRFTDLITFQEICMTRLRTLVAGGHMSQYLAFTDVKKGTIDEIDRMREERRGWLPRMTILYDGREQVLIVKLMVGVAHELGARQFGGMFEAKWMQLGLPWDALGRIGAARFGDPSRRSKEGDVSYKPMSRRRKEDWPSVVIEAGVSESLAELHADADFWLTKSGGQTHIVIVISINRIAREIVIERWENVPRTRPTCASSGLSTGLMQSITLTDHTQDAGGSLVIPADKVFDVVPQGVPAGEFEFTMQDLRRFSASVWLLYS